MADHSLATRISEPRRRLLADAAFAVLLQLFVWAQMIAPRIVFGMGGGGGGVRPRVSHGGIFFPLRLPVVPPEALILAAFCVLPLVFRRRYPLAVLTTVSVATVAYQLLGFPPSMVVLGVLVALYTAGTLVERRRFALWAAACGGLVVGSGLPAWEATTFWPEAVRGFSTLAVAAAIGEATRNRRAYVAEVEQRAIEAERTREEEARRRVDEERLRIARELHDITAHSLSIVAVQSGAALHVLDEDPEAARSALKAIRDTSRSSLQELRTVLGVLRGGAGGDLPLAPAPGIARLDDLVTPLRDAGLDVQVDADLTEPLPSIVDASAYRIVQEALTNVLRHAGRTTVRVTLAHEGDELMLEVADDGVGGVADTDHGGHGIVGMRERALALGGTFEAGPRTGGGWRVAATLPLTGRGAA